MALFAEILQIYDITYTQAVIQYRVELPLIIGDGVTQINQDTDRLSARISWKIQNDNVDIQNKYVLFYKHPSSTLDFEFFEEAFGYTQNDSEYIGTIIIEKPSNFWDAKNIEVNVTAEQREWENQQSVLVDVYESNIL